MAKKGERPGKGVFGESRLPVAPRYPIPISRRGLLLPGALSVVVVWVVAVADFGLRNGVLLSNGPLSSNHASFERECAACHLPPGALPRAKCAECHERLGDELGVYGFPAHYLYRADDPARIETAARDHAGRETECAACHLEHRGREAEITQVADARCLACHDYGSFDDRHPEFAFAREGLADADTLAFTHMRHTREVMQQTGFADVERACLFCHHADPDGKGFQPIDFDLHCDACHLSDVTRTPPLPVRGGGALGVETPAMIRSRGGGGVGTRWASFANPDEYEERGGLVSKRPIYHRDPWVLENLRRLRREVYPESDLADLLAASADVPPGRPREIYREAIGTLEGYASELRSRTEEQVQDELKEINNLLRRLLRQIDDPLAVLDLAPFRPLPPEGAPGVPRESVAVIERLSRDLTQPCVRCHQVAAGSITRVQADQRVLWRAEFDHRAHILVERCLDCHGEIPILRYEELADDEGGVDPRIDAAAIQNLPRIAKCQECHTPRLASIRCVTCHDFHPDKTRRSELLVSID